MEFIDVPHNTNIVEKRRSTLSSGKLLYLQPIKRRPLTYNRLYKKPMIKIESDTTYGQSYMKLECSPKLKIDYGMRKKIGISSTGKFDFDTTYKLSYQPSERIISRAYKPQPTLCMSGVHDMSSIYMSSYMNPGHSRAILCKPYRGKIYHVVPMENKTVTKESYQHFGGHVENKKRWKPGFWQTKFKTDYQTTNQLSYQYIRPISKRGHIVRYRPNISTPIEKDTIYKTSYQVPGRFVEKENVTCA